VKIIVYDAKNNMNEIMIIIVKNVKVDISGMKRIEYANHSIVDQMKIIVWIVPYKVR
jgi:hypothetical protein